MFNIQIMYNQHNVDTTKQVSKFQSKLIRSQDEINKIDVFLKYEIMY
jgi:hypothetical protein